MSYRTPIAVLTLVLACSRADHQPAASAVTPAATPPAPVPPALEETRQIPEVAVAPAGDRKSARGQIADVRTNEVVVERGDGPDLILRVERQTAVTVRGEKAGIRSLAIGTPVRVEYHLMKDQPVADSIETTRPARQGRRPR